jgi:hypothetical protein
MPVERARAEAEAVQLGVEAAEVGAAIDALLVAQLLRWHDRDRLEVPHSWREGLLLPMRRVVLRLARQDDQSWPLDKLRHQHRQSFLRPTGPLTPDPKLHRRIENDSREDAWGWVRWALMNHLGLVEEQTDWEAKGPKWVLARPPSTADFAQVTVAKARRVQERLRTRIPRERLEAQLQREEQIARPRRWLQALRDARLVRRRGDHYEWERDAQLHPPRGY